jgi:hypothetical protein
MAKFLVSSCFLFLCYVWATHILDLVCTKQICFLNVIIHELAEA